MSRGLIFWILMLVWLVFFLLTSFVAPGFASYGRFTPILEFILFLLLGWQVYGSPVKG